jgi:hypothetical protein
VRRVVRRQADASGGSSERARVGDRVAAAARGRVRRGTVQYADKLQNLVKWNGGSSSSLRVGDRSRIVK